MTESIWKRRGEEIFIGLIVSAVWVLIGYLVHIGSPWFKPIAYGALVSCAALLSYAAIVVLIRTPRRRILPNEKNIEKCVRTWLDTYKVTVKNDPAPNADFRLRITLDSGIQITVVRLREEYNEYVQIIADLGIRGEDKKLLDSFTDAEKSQILLDLKFELTRAKLGYGGLVLPAENFHIFRRVPIHPNLTEFIFMAIVGEVEAGVNLVLLTFLKTKLAAEKNMR